MSKTLNKPINIVINYMFIGGRTSQHKKILSFIITLSFLMIFFQSFVSISGTGTISGEGDTPAALPEPDKISYINRTAEIENILRNIDENLMAKYIQKLQDFESRNSYNVPYNYRASDYIYEQFLDNGLDTKFDYFQYAGWDMRNVVGELIGTTNPNDIYIIGAHYDSTSGSPYTDAPGADDNGSGTAAVLAAAEILSDYEFNYTVRFITFSGEEQYLKGSQHYVSDAFFAGENILGFLNLDMIGYNPDETTLFELMWDTDDGINNVITNEQVYGPATGDGTEQYFWLNNGNITTNTLYMEEFGTPGTYYYLIEGPDYTLNYTTGFIDLSSGWGPMGVFENLTAWYNYTFYVSGALISFTNQTVQKYEYISNLQTVYTIGGNSDHGAFVPTYPGLMLHEYTFNNGNYHTPSDTIDKLNMTYAANITQVAVATLAELAQLNKTDRMGPAIHHRMPVPGGFSNATPEISFEMMDVSGLDISNFKLIVDGAEVTPTLTQISLGRNATYTPPAPYLDGQVITVRVIVNDTNGNGLDTTWSFTVDAVAPGPPTSVKIELARYEFTKQFVAIDKGQSGDPDFRHALAPSVIFKDGEYKMWYAGHDGSYYQIIYANSTDGQTWVKYGVVVPKGSIGADDGLHASHPNVMFEAGEYKMWYSGHNGTAWRILYATSIDGLNWTKQGRAFDLGADGEDDDVLAYSPSVLKTDEYEMWYTGVDGITERILYANSSDGVTWNKHGIVMNPSMPGFFDAQRVMSPNVIKINNIYTMYYSGFDGIKYRILTANSTDGLNWTKSGLAIDLGGALLDVHARESSVIKKDGELKLWYSGLYGNWRIIMANLTGNENKTDVSLTWQASTSSDVVRYEIYRASTPDSFDMSQPYRKTKELALIDKSFGDDNSSNYYYIVRAVDRVGNYGQHPYILGKIGQSFDAGWNILSTPFETANTSLAFNLESLGSWTYAMYYDHRGGESTVAVADEPVFGPAAGGETGPFSLGNTTITDISLYNDMEGLWILGEDYTFDWTTGTIDISAGATHLNAGESLIAFYNYTQPADYWKSNDTSRPAIFNDLGELNNTMGLWVKTEDNDTYATVGTVANITIELLAGWNFVSYPYHLEKTVQNALAGLPHGPVEGHDPGQPYGVINMLLTDTMEPGKGYWVYMLADFTWNIINT